MTNVESQQPRPDDLVDEGRAARAGEGDVQRDPLRHGPHDPTESLPIRAIVWSGRGPDAVASFLKTYPPAVSEVVSACATTIRVACPVSRETVDPARASSAMASAWIQRHDLHDHPEPDGIKLGIVRGAELPNLDGLLTGAGKVIVTSS